MNAPDFPPTHLPAIERTANASLEAKLRHKIDHKTKPLGALGRLESLALQLGLIQQSDTVTLREPQMVVFAADHGIADEGVSAFPQAVTVQMVGNMLAGGAAINVFARQHGFVLQVADAGVAADLPVHPQLLQRKIAHGTRNIANEAAMTPAQAQAALQAGMDIVQNLPGNVVAFGEMGIANTSAAALLFARLAGVSIDDATGRGTGLDDVQLAHKRRVLAAALVRHAGATQPLDVLAALGGFEIAMMAGAMLQAASERRVVLVDGFIAGAAALMARALAPAVQDYLVFCHQGNEHGHRLLLAHLKAQPLLALDLRLGEGTGALLAWPLVQSAAGFLNEMASFESAGVSGKEGT
ncbi:MULTISPECIES: nicotinate-nucleotide--dimethylbenzimidazole phosphoribosyltransferase [unclassified Polaromonas]|uniref:nicotinate-nucleotide--dimethylbenzimidazole phosphoribosyltransferase n=1 Tax=unclassified Polaromonas TaxID=2638319 RepID=UPI000F09408F|nr:MULTISPECIES: nicotinate-nucleotide--dimethylbenzimidazole phosphoribosyltransferase [unclassified Polaromonas]AYQ28327.1 nicotinate-nucleotide--dimethylbenzimidazole phosphoribosyltransferase [Polaromonas sp. SP1]QGJ20554.1 nicotinate-nucleotide--dimethylbenzimidazole phosphoribosyltransferase [Polaromonas sp. Pch-P]